MAPASSAVRSCANQEGWALERNGLRAETTLFVDDAMHNVEAARALGLPAIHFQGPQALRAELAQRGLL